MIELWITRLKHTLKIYIVLKGLTVNKNISNFLNRAFHPKYNRPLGICYSEANGKSREDSWFTKYFWKYTVTKR